MAQANELNQLTNWFLWSDDNIPSTHKHYKSKFSTLRANQRLCNGGMGLWNWHDRSQSCIAKLAGWMSTTDIAELKHHWAKSRSSLQSLPAASPTILQALLLP